MGISILVSQTPPTKQNDSIYPPNLFDGFKPNTEEWLIWFTTTWTLYFLEDFADEYDEFSDLFEGFELLFPHPLRIVETYEYNGTETIEIKGEAVFDLYFTSKMISNLGSNDKVNVGLYSLNLNSLLPIPNMIKNETTEITPELLKNINKQTVIINNINHTLEPGESLLFKVELIPGNKTITEWLKKERPILKEFGNRALDLLIDIANSSGNPTLQIISEFIDEIGILAEELNITKEDASEILNSIISSSLVYDSAGHPSSVTLPFKTPEANENKNTKIYYLHTGKKMDERKPTKEDHSSNNLMNSLLIQLTNESINLLKVWYFISPQFLIF